MMMNDGMKCKMRPADGEPKGQPDAQNRENGMTPSFASSWLTRDWVKVTVNTLPNALMGREDCRSLNEFLKFLSNPSSPSSMSTSIESGIVALLP